MIVFNFAGAGTSGIAGNATLLYLDVNMSASISAGNHIPVNLLSVVVNEGNPKLKVNGGCIDVTTATAVDEPANSDIKIAYYKSSGIIRIDNIPENCKALSVYNIAGQKVLRLKIADSSSLINVSGWDSGIYLVQIDKDKKGCSKIIL